MFCISSEQEAEEPLKYDQHVKLTLCSKSLPVPVTIYGQPAGLPVFQTDVMNRRSPQNHRTMIQKSNICPDLISSSSCWGPQSEQEFCSGSEPVLCELKRLFLPTVSDKPDLGVSSVSAEGTSGATLAADLLAAGKRCFWVWLNLQTQQDNLFVFKHDC